MLRFDGVKKRRKELEAAFTAANKDGDGFLKQEEWLQFCEDNGIQATREDIDQIFAARDKDHNGVLSFREFTGQMCKAEMAFKAFDQTGDGFVSRADFKKACPKMTDAQIDAAIAKYDTSEKDGMLNYREFCDMLNSQRRIKRQKE